MSVGIGVRWVVPAVVLLCLSAAAGAGAAEKAPGTPASDRTPPPVVVSVRDGDFDWADAGVGAAAMLAATLLAVGVAMALRPPRSTASRQALSSAQREEP